MKELIYGYYATRIYLPLSDLSRRLRQFSQRLRGISDRSLQITRLPEISWKNCTKQRLIKIWDHEKRDGNIRISELGILSGLAADCENGSSLFEIGTFDGRTTLNFALNAPEQCKIYTLDLPSNFKTADSSAKDERQLRPVLRYEAYRKDYPDAVGRVHPLLGDSADFDYSPYTDFCSLVFVDGCHCYDHVISDSWAAMHLVKKGGIIIWHDYGVWKGVTQGLEVLERREGYGLRKIRGTSLVYWKKA